MISAVLDTNVFVQAIIGPVRSSSARVLDEYAARRFNLLVSKDTAAELHHVLCHSSVRRRHFMTEAEIARFVPALLRHARVHEPEHVVSPRLPRDVSDTKMLDLALATAADFLVTNDRRHLIRLKSIGKTLIVTPAKFLVALS
jgi:putative PIN family toxin of toxin-antitoxin system